MADSREQLIVEVIDKAVSNLKSITKELQQTNTALDTTAKAATKTNASFLEIAKGIGVFAVADRALHTLASTMKDSVSQATQYQMAMTGLSSVANYFGITQEEAKKSAQSLASDGLMTVADAGNSLKQLLASGLNLDQAQKLMEAYKNEAAFGRVNTIDYTQAVGNLAESFKTENSMIGNLSGQTENYSYILDIGAAKLGKKTAALTATERVQAKYLGTLEVAKKNEGDAAKMSDTFAGAQARLTVAIQNQKIALGEAIQYGLTPFYNALTDILSPTEEVGEKSEESAGKVGFLGTAFAAAGNYAAGALYGFKAFGEGLLGIVEFIPTAATTIAEKIKNSIDNVFQVFDNLLKKIQSTGDAIKDFVTGNWGGAKESAQKALGIGLFDNMKTYVPDSILQDNYKKFADVAQKANDDLITSGNYWSKAEDIRQNGIALPPPPTDNLGSGGGGIYPEISEDKKTKYVNAFKNISDQAYNYLKKFRENAKKIQEDFDKTIDEINKKRSDLNKKFSVDVANAVLDIQDQIKTLNDSLKSTNTDYADQMASSIIDAQDQLTSLQKDLQDQMALGSLDQDQSYIETLQSQIQTQEGFLSKHADVIKDVQANIDEQRRVSGLDEIDKLQEEKDSKIEIIQQQVDEEQAILDAHSKWIKNNQAALVEAERAASLDKIQILKEQLLTDRALLDADEKQAKKDKKTAKKENRADLRDNFKDLIKNFIEDTQNLGEKSKTVSGQALTDIQTAEGKVNKVGRKAVGKNAKGNIYQIDLNVTSGESIDSILAKLVTKMKTI